jgi:hypothetical protein
MASHSNRASGRRASTLAVRGKPGMGKAVLLDYLAGPASGCRVARAVGVVALLELP